jgi:hypothetical protein
MSRVTIEATPVFLTSRSCAYGAWVYGIEGNAYMHVTQSTDLQRLAFSFEMCATLGNRDGNHQYMGTSPTFEVRVCCWGDALDACAASLPGITECGGVQEDAKSHRTLAARAACKRGGDKYVCEASIPTAGALVNDFQAWVVYVDERWTSEQLYWQGKLRSQHGGLSVVQGVFLDTVDVDGNEEP